MITKEDAGNFERNELVKIVIDKRKEFDKFYKEFSKRSKDLDEFGIVMLKVSIRFEDIEMQQKNIRQLEKLLYPSNNESNDFEQKVDRVKEIPIANYIHQNCEGIKERGHKITCLSPLTNEKTPSFHVDTQKNVWYCFSTSQGGDLIKLVQLVHGLSFKETINFLLDNSYT